MKIHYFNQITLRFKDYILTTKIIYIVIYFSNIK